MRLSLTEKKYEVPAGRLRRGRAGDRAGCPELASKGGCQMDGIRDIRNIIRIEVLQSIQDEFAEATGISSTLKNPATNFRGRAKKRPKGRER